MNELSGPGEDMHGSGECACLLIDPARSCDAQLQGPQHKNGQYLRMRCPTI
jgi:hypothetical protein